MSSEIKVSSVKAKDGTAGISIADSTGNVSLSGTLTAGTLGLNISHTVGWQHIQTFHHTSSSTDTNEIFFNNVFSNDYISFCLHIGNLIPSGNPFDINMRLTSGGNSPSEHSDGSWYGRNRHHTQGDSDYESTTFAATAYFPLVQDASGNDVAAVMAGEVYFYDVSSPTVLGVSADRGTNYHPMVKSSLIHYQGASGTISAGYAETMTAARFNTGHGTNDYTGFKLWTNNSSGSAVNLMDGSHMSLFGLKAQATS